MRLLVDQGHGDLSLVEYYDNEIPPYAILSHTWGEDSEEVTFKDLIEGTGKNKSGYDKIEFCRKQAAVDRLQHFWVDTCCIEKSSSAELTEAINSMFRWYKNAEKCYVYLSDVSVSGRSTTVESSLTTWELAFRKSRWFSRGWTLQELIAPASVEFFSQEGDRLNSKTSLEQLIHEVTGIAIEALRGQPLTHFEVEERLSWATHRQTKRQEDEAYSLLGIFNIHMPLLYGEGREKAFVRLRKEINESSPRKGDTYAIPRCFRTSDYHSHMKSIPRRSSGTCEWFTRQSCYQEWWTSQEPGLLWYARDPGSGKSVMSRYLIEDVLAESSLPLTYYFFPPGLQPIASIVTAFHAVMHQLYTTFPKLTQTAVKAFDQNGEQLLEEPWSLWSLFQESIQVSGINGLICIFDGLDQCKEKEVQLLGALISESACKFTGSQTRLKFVLTSRPYPHIQRMLRGLKRQLAVFQVDGPGENENIRRDVRLFIENRVSELGTDLELSEQEQAYLKCKLTRNRNDSFLWPYLVTEELRNSPPSVSIEVQVDQLPLTVVAAYEDILNRCPDRKAVRVILSIVLVALRPLTLDEMSFVLSNNDMRARRLLGHQHLKRVSETLTHLSGLFLRITNSRIYLFHQTARDFLLCEQVNAQHAKPRPGQQYPWERSFTLASSHYIATMYCVRCVRLRKIPEGVQAFQQLLVETPFLAYADQNWNYHASATLRYCKAKRQSLCIQGFLGHGLNMQMLDSEGKSLLHRIIDTHVMVVDVSLVQHVLSHGGLVTSADHDNMTCMHYAALRADSRLVNVLFNAGFPINTNLKRKPRFAQPGTTQERLSSAGKIPSIKPGLNALHAAVFFGRPSIINPLFKCGIDVNAMDEDGHTPLHLALSQSLPRPKKDDLWEQDIYMVGHIEDYEEEGVDEIINMSKESRLSVIKMLCDHPAIHISSQDNHGRTPLHDVQYGTEEYGAITAKVLIDRGADRLARDKDGRIPIHRAARAGDVRSLKILVRKPEDLMICDQDGRNALHFVAQSQCRDAACFVLQTARHLNIHHSVDVEGRNALHHALSDGTQTISHVPWEMVSLLLKSGVSAKQIDYHGRDVLAHYVTNLFFNADLRTVALMLVFGANGQYKDAGGRTLAHHLVCIEDEIRVTAWQLIRAWDLGSEALDKDNRNILHHAAIHGSITADFLPHIKRYLHVNSELQDTQGLTAFDYALRKSHLKFGLSTFRRHRWQFAVAALNGLGAFPPIAAGIPPLEDIRDRDANLAESRHDS